MEARSSSWPAVLAGLLCLGAAACYEPGPAQQVANRNPVIESLGIIPSEVLAGRAVQVRVHATDPDGDPLSYEYLPDAGRIVGEGPDVLWVSPDQPAVYGIQVVVRDPAGLTAMHHGELRVTKPTLILGEAYFLGGVSADLDSALVAIFHSDADWNEDLFAQPPVHATQVVHNMARFRIDVLEPSRYWLAFFKDVNGNGLVDPGDIYGKFGMDASGHGSSFEIRAGQTANVVLYVSTVPAAGRAPSR